jgi:riboflavin kinase / FMN adenylyltransferase
MQVLYVDEHNLSALQQQAVPMAVALGYFDGVHLGHREVIRTARQQADAHGLTCAILSFFPHPKSVLVSGYNVKYLEPIEQKIEKLEALGVDIFYIVKFTKELAALSPIDFLNEYVLGLRAEQIVCGFDYRFGARASGKAQEIVQYVPSHVGVKVVPELKWQGNKISSTLIRDFIKSSRVDEIPSILGDYYITKYCFKNGILPNYSMPSDGRYKVLLETDCTVQETIITVKCPKLIDVPWSTSSDEDVLTIHWLKKIS